MSSRTAGMAFSIRSALLLLVLAVLLPGIVGAAWLIGTTAQAERDAHERRLRDTSRALSMVVDRELSQRAVIARLLSQSRWLDDGPPLAGQQLALFEQEARRAMQGLDGWLELRDARGVLLDTRHPAPAVTPAPGFDDLVSTAEVRPLQVVAGADSAHASIVQPVVRGGRVWMNLVITLRPVELQRMLDEQRLPAGWVGTVLDSRGAVVARQPGGSAFVGRLATADLRARMQSGTEGLFESTSLDGAMTTGFYSTSRQGWTYVSAMPRSQFSGVIPQAMPRVLLAALALLAVAGAGAVWLSRRIAGPVQGLKAAAAALQAGTEVSYRASGLTECDEVGRALVAASQTLQSSRSELERQVVEAVARTRQAEQGASRSQRVEALGRLTGGVAHDFNNLLGVISNSAHLIDRHPAAADLRLPVSALRRAVDSGALLTQHLLRFAGRRSVRPQKVELTRFLPEVLELMRSVLGRRIEIHVDVAADTRAVEVDVGELELALVNLGLNSRDAMPQGGELMLRARNAEAEDIQDLPPVGNGYVLITVGDDGPGIPQDLADRVFEPFFTTKAVGQGSGLGLSQVHGFCTQAGGTARLASTQGLGTTVSLILPAATERGTAPDSRDARASVAGLRVLLVEDNEGLGDVTAALLQSHGATVQRADSGDQAMALLQTPHFYDVVLSDVVMPGTLDGLALARWLRINRPQTGVVLISGYQTAVTDSEFTVLQKPCPEVVLLLALRHSVDRGRAAGAR